MKVAVYQSPPTDGDVDAAFARIERVLGAAALAGAQMAVLPELYLPGYNRPDLHMTHAQRQGGSWERRLSQICRDSGCGLTIGWAERDGDLIFNAASVFDQTGTKLAHYRKRQLFGPMEKSVFSPGDDLVTFDLDGRHTALLICYDVEFAELVRHLSNRGVQLLLVPTANPAGFEIVSDALVPARAYETGMTIAYANYCGPEDGLAYAGQSLICGPDGMAIASAGRGEALLVVDINVADQIDRAQLSTQGADWRPLTT